MAAGDSGTLIGEALRRATASSKHPICIWCNTAGPDLALPADRALERLGALEEERDRIVEALRFSTECGDLADRQIVVERYVDGLEAGPPRPPGKAPPLLKRSSARSRACMRSSAEETSRSRVRSDPASHCPRFRMRFAAVADTQTVGVRPQK